MYKLHKRVRQLFLFSYGNRIRTCATVKEHIEDKIFKIVYIISHKIYNNRFTALSTSKNYTYLIEVRFLVEGSITNMTCIFSFMNPFLALHLSILLMTKIILYKLFVRTIDSLYVYIN